MDRSAAGRASGPQASRPVELVFVHGMYHGPWCWEEFQRDFVAAGYRCHLVDLRAPGAETFRPGLDQCFENLSRVLDALGEEVVVVGHSLGGMLTLRYLEERPVTGAVLLSTPDGRALRRAFWRLALRFPLQVLWALATFSPDRIYHSLPIMRHLFFRSEPDTDPERRAMERIALQSESRRLVVRAGLFRFRKPRHGTRTLVVAGGEDPTVNADCAARVARIANAETWILDGQPHDLMIGPGARALCGRLLDWLQEL